MSHKLIKDESGMTMGLTVIMVVLIGVMGAGLLTFVRNDLISVVEVNQGQKAIDIADAGVQAGKGQLYSSDTTREHYDWDYTNDCVPSGQRLRNEDWSPATTRYANADCTGGTVSMPTPGVTKNFAGGSFTVTISCYRQLGETEALTPCKGAPSGAAGTAPEDIGATRRAYFKITSTGCIPADCSGAKRKVEAIYYAALASVPTAYYSKRDIEFAGSPTVKGISFFAKGDIRLSNASPVRCLETDLPGTCQALFGDWDTTRYDTPTNLNTVPRTTASGVRTTGVGFAAEGTVTGNGYTVDGVHDYDSTTATKGSKKKFVQKTNASAPNSAGIISYPFVPDASFDIEALKAEAQKQGNYCNRLANIGDRPLLSTDACDGYPRGSTQRTVYFMDANSTADSTYTVGYTPRAKGIVVVNNGNLLLSSSSTGFNGIIIVTGNGSTTGRFENKGSGNLDGFAVADANII